MFFISLTNINQELYTLIPSYHVILYPISIQTFNSYPLQNYKSFTYSENTILKSTTSKVGESKIKSTQLINIIGLKHKASFP